ncbi:MAG: hypothetical protein RIC07_33175 [Coleofasciculus sp. E1-EBD-02]
MVNGILLYPIRYVIPTPTQEVCDRVDDKQVSGQKFSATLSR